MITSFTYYLDIDHVKNVKLIEYSYKNHLLPAVIIIPGDTIRSGTEEFIVNGERLTLTDIVYNLNWFGIRADTPLFIRFETFKENYKQMERERILEKYKSGEFIVSAKMFE